VTVDAGASTTAVAPYAVRRDRIDRLAIQRSPGFGGTFVLGGSLAATFTVDCVGRPRRVVESVTSPLDNGRRVALRRSVYALRGETFVALSVRSHRLSPQLLSHRFPEFRDRRGPFGACTRG